MKTFHRLFIALTGIMFIVNGFAQNNNNSHSDEKIDYASHPYWIDMMDDPTVNFYDVQKAFNAYFENRDKGKGSGWKQFKRWEYFMEQRVYPTGKRINSSQAWDEMKKFNNASSNKKGPNDNTWDPLGPATSQNITGHWNPGLGRINVIARDPDSPETLYIGAPAGGLWKTENEGLDWIVLTDNLSAIGVSAIAIDYTDTDIIYIGTGDRDHADTYSIGVLKSTDGGFTWEETGLDWNIYQQRTIAKLLIHPDDPEILFAATTNGLYKTIDGGENWYLVQDGDIDDMEFKPGNPDVIYAVTKNLYRSTDGGESFDQISGLPSQYRVQIAVTEANENYLYFFSSQDGIYRSEDSGLTFEKRSDEPTQGRQDWYDLAFAASHTDAEEVHCGEINTYRSDNGGQSWTQTTEWIWPNSIGYTHCDIHEMVFFGGTLYVGSDGLISKSTDSGDNWENLSEGIVIRQFYRVGGTQSNPYKLLGGSQDNGTSVFTEDEWHEWLGADGMECLADYTNDNIVYGTSQGGNFYKSNTGGYEGSVSISQPGGGAWVSPFIIHPTDPLTLFAGVSEVKKTSDGMQSWTTLTNVGNGNVNALAISTSNPDYLYFSKGSVIYRTKNGGEDWENISSGLPGLYISYIAVYPEDEDVIAVSLSGYNDGDKVYISDDGGDTWTNYSENLPNLPANCVAFNNDNSNGLYVGMDVGVYYRDQTLDEWESFMEGLPNVIVSELEIHFASGLIRAATFGRGLWETELHPTIPDEIEMTYVVRSGGDDVVEYGEITYLDVTLKNNMSEVAENVIMTIDTDNQHITLIDENEEFGDIPPGDSVVVVDAFSFDVSPFIPNDNDIVLNTTITYDSILIDKIKLVGYAPVLATDNITVSDGDNNQIDPGDAAIIDLTVDNDGGSSATTVEVNITTDDTYVTLGNNSANFAELIPNQEEPMSFNITVDESAPIGHIIILQVEIDADKEYSNTDTIAFTVGRILEDFETGDFYKFNWKDDGDNNWTIDDQDVYEGIYSARSGEIDDNQESILLVEMDVIGSGEISFYKKVSCEDHPGGTGYDFLAFLIDDEEQGRWDGEIDWSEETFAVESGTHTFKWVFYKDGYVSEGQDAAWVDYIVFPPVATSVGVEKDELSANENPVIVFPNPTTNQTTINFTTNNETLVKLDIFNSAGVKVNSLINNTQMEKGNHSVVWYGNDQNGTKVPNGVYYYRLEAGEQFVGRILVLR